MNNKTRPCIPEFSLNIFRVLEGLAGYPTVMSETFEELCRRPFPSQVLFVGNFVFNFRMRLSISFPSSFQTFYQMRGFSSYPGW